MPERDEARAGGAPERSRRWFPSGPHEADSISWEIEQRVASASRARDERDLAIAGRIFPTEEHREAFYDQEPALHERERLLAQGDAARAQLTAAASQGRHPTGAVSDTSRPVQPARPVGRGVDRTQHER